MFRGWRFQLREAEEAADQGQLDEACRLLVGGQLSQYLPGKRLTARVARLLAERARRRVIQGDLMAGWRDLQAARQLAGEIAPVLAARQEIIELMLGEAEGHLENDQPARAIEVLEQLDRWDVQDEPLRRMKEVARHLESARNLALRGRFADAQTQALAADKIHPCHGFAKQKAAHYAARIAPFREQTQQLHQALAQRRWSDAAELADQLLELAPASSLASDARRRAWAHVGTRVDQGGPVAAQQGPVTGGAAIATAPREGGTVALAENTLSPRFLLWIDGVGGYLVCLSDQVVLGQATPRSRVEIPIQADLSRRHASIERQGDGYVVEPFHETWVNGQQIRGKTLLSDGDELEMSGGVRLRFRQPHALSASARLEFASHHRTQPKADAVLLMAESCVLGPKRQNHVTCRDWQGDVVLYRRDGELFCRAMESIEIDGHLCDGRGRLSSNSHVSGSDFSLSLEELS